MNRTRRGPSATRNDGLRETHARMQGEPGPVLNLRYRGEWTEAERRNVVRVDRASRWGNPFRMQAEAERDRVIAQHRAWLWQQIDEGAVGLDELAALAGRPLACWCAPRRCHGETLARAAVWAHRRLGEQTTNARSKTGTTRRGHAP